LAVTIRLYLTAARSPPRSEPQNNQDFRTPPLKAALRSEARC